MRRASVLVRYNKDGTLAFSLNYNEGEKTDAFLAEPQKNKDIYLKFYEGELDNIREVNASNPQNYIEYNLASGEYTVYKNSELIKGGKICGYEIGQQMLHHQQVPHLQHLLHHQ